MNNNANGTRLLFVLSFLASALLLTRPVPAQDTPPVKETAAPTAQTEPYSDRGADTCAKCHDEDSEYPVYSIYKTKHAQSSDVRTPFAKLQCETCHGPGGKHAEKVRPGQKQAPIITFGRKSTLPVAEQNRICLDCHQGQHRIAWQGSAHAQGEVACANCHVSHAARDRVLSAPEQPEVCFGCHLRTRADFHKPSTHPVRFGQLACSECHNTHGSMTNRLLARPTLNETCYGCHAEKRGPFLWEHAPVAEDCSVCHVPHGSIHPALLSKRPPLLCQQCHSQSGHPSVARTGSGLPSGTPSAFLLAGSCMNCHSQVHGSNHPSGVKLMR